MPIDSTILDASPDAFLLVEGETVRWANAGAARMLGTTVSAMVGRDFADLLGAGERERLRLLEEQRNAGWDLPATCRVRFVRVSDGREVTTDLRVGNVPGRGALEFIVCARDVTEVTRAERLMGNLAQLSSSGTAMLDANALLDASEPLFEALGWRVAFTEIVDGFSITRRMLAAPLGDPVGDYVRSIIGVRMPFEKTPILAEVVRTGHPLFLDNLPQLSSGPTRNATALGASMERAHVIRSAWCPIVTDGRLTHLLAATGRDLTEHDFVAIQLFAAQVGAASRMSQLRAEVVHRERLAAVGEMAAVLAHEVRNPLGVIFNALSELRKPPDATPKSAELLGIVHEEAERLKRLVNDLLDFSRPSVPQMQSVAVVTVINQAIAAARLDPSCPDAPDIAVDITPNLPPARTDAHLLRRALINLVVNAIHGVSADGKVTVSAAVEDEGELRLQIHNDGEPIPPAVAARVFEPFFTTKATGTGLGLAVVRRIVDELGGRVELDPSNQGASFSVWLPVSRATSGPIG